MTKQQLVTHDKQLINCRNDDYLNVGFTYMHCR